MGSKITQKPWPTFGLPTYAFPNGKVGRLLGRRLYWGFPKKTLALSPVQQPQCWQLCGFESLRTSNLIYLQTKTVECYSSKRFMCHIFSIHFLFVIGWQTGEVVIIFHCQAHKKTSVRLTRLVTWSGIFRMFPVVLDANLLARTIVYQHGCGASPLTLGRSRSLTSSIRLPREHKENGHVTDFSASAKLVPFQPLVDFFVRTARWRIQKVNYKVMSPQCNQRRWIVRCANVWWVDSLFMPFGLFKMLKRYYWKLIFTKEHNIT